jgi:hypothetical protein
LKIDDEGIEDEGIEDLLELLAVSSSRPLLLTVSKN